MAKPHKIVHVMQYTETVYYDGDGAEVARERNHDDHTYDTRAAEDMTAQEIEDYIGGDE
jgi:hypothetical protein